MIVSQTKKLVDTRGRKNLLTAGTPGSTPAKLAAKAHSYQITSLYVTRRASTDGTHHRMSIWNNLFPTLTETSSPPQIVGPESFFTLILTPPFRMTYQRANTAISGGPRSVFSIESSKDLTVVPYFPLHNSPSPRSPRYPHNSSNRNP